MALLMAMLAVVVVVVGRFGGAEVQWWGLCGATGIRMLVLLYML